MGSIAQLTVTNQRQLTLPYAVLLFDDDGVFHSWALGDVETVAHLLRESGMDPSWYPAEKLKTYAEERVEWYPTTKDIEKDHETFAHAMSMLQVRWAGATVMSKGIHARDLFDHFLRIKPADAVSGTTEPT